MKLEITLPTVTCIRCGTTASSKPYQLRRLGQTSYDTVAAVDEDGERWLCEQPGLPSGWDYCQALTTDVYRGLCPTCLELWAEHKAAFLPLR